MSYFIDLTVDPACGKIPRMHTSNIFVKQANPAAKASRLMSLLKNPMFQGSVAAVPWTIAEYKGYNPVMRDIPERPSDPVQKGIAYAANALSMAELVNPKRRVPAGLAFISGLMSTPAIHSATKGFQALDNAVDQTRINNQKDFKRLALMGTLGTGALGLGLGTLGLGYMGVREARKARKQMEKPKDVRDPGRVRITLPTRDPHDAETQIELPLDHAKLTQTAITQLRRDIRRKLRDEGEERTLTRRIAR